VTRYTEHVISIRYEDYEYTGGAHGNTVTSVRNYWRSPIASIYIGGLFKDATVAADRLSDHCRHVIEAENGDKSPNEWVRKGIWPAIGCFDKFNIVESGLLVTFDPYTVGSYAEGIRRVHVPRGLLAAHLTDGTESRLWA
jgi:hypothetical protein